MSRQLQLLVILPFYRDVTRSNEDRGTERALPWRLYVNLTVTVLLVVGLTIVITWLMFDWLIKDRFVSSFMLYH